MKLILEAIKSLLRSMKNSIHVTQKAVADVDAKANSAKEVANEAYESSIIAQGMARNAQAAVGDRLDKISPSGTGTFSMNRKANTTIGIRSTAMGNATTASGYSSTAMGNTTTAQRRSQHVQGEFNLLDTYGSTSNRGKYAHIVGNGTSDTKRSNAHTLDWNGLGWFAGGLKVGGTGQDDANAKEVALKEDIPQGGVEQFRHIRTVVIPEDASTDTSGVNWLEREQGGYWFGFDTDENGEPFSLTEIFCVSVNVTCSNPSWGSFDVAIGSPVPSYGYWGAGQFYLPVPVGKQGEVKTGFAYSVLFSNGNSVGWNAAFAGGVSKLESISKESSAGDSYTKIESMRTFINNGNAYGFLAGSTFKFYGR